MNIKNINTIEELEELLGKIPLCSCGCGQQVKVTLTPWRIKEYHNHGYPKVLKGHSNSLHLSKIYTIKELENMMGILPICNCGCGKKVIVSLKYGSIRQYHSKGYPLYIQGHHVKGTKNPMHNPLAKAKFFETINDPEFKAEHYGINHPMFGIPKSQELKDKISKAQSGENGYWYGKAHTDESNLKRKQTMRGKNKGQDNAMFGITPAIESAYGKGTHFYSPLQGEIYLRSTWEVAYAKYLDALNEPWFYELETFYFDDFTYTPDFFLPRQEKFIEIKGYMSESSRIKVKAFQEEYPFDLQVLYRNNLIGLGIKL